MHPGLAAILSSQPIFAPEIATGYEADGDARLADPGYYLIASGRPGFEAAIGFRPSPKTWPGRALT